MNASRMAGTTSPSSGHPRRRTRTAPLLHSWVGAFVVAEVVGFGIAAPIAAGGIAVIDASAGGWKVLAAVCAGVLAGVAEGSAVGWMQWWVIRRVLPAIGRGAWVGATAGSAALAWVIGLILGAAVAPDGEPSPLLVLVVAALMGFSLGALLGVGQAIVLRRNVDRSGSWILANGFGWMIGMVVSFAGSGLVGPDSSIVLIVVTAAMTGAAMALAPALTTGWALLRLTNHSQRLSSRAGPWGGTRRMLNRVANPAVTRLLRSRWHPILSRHLALITVTGQRTGRAFTLPVGYVCEGTQVVILSYRERTWWRNLIGSSPVMLRLRGQDRPAIAEVDQDAGTVAATLQQLGPRLMHRSLAPDEPAVLAARTVIVRATLLSQVGTGVSETGGARAVGDPIREPAA